MSFLNRPHRTSQTKPKIYIYIIFNVPIPVCVGFICLFKINFVFFIDDCSARQSATLSLRPKKSVEDKLKVEKDGKVFFLRSSNRVTAAPAEIDSDDNDDDIDEERMQRFLSEGILDEDNDEIDDDAEALKSVERKCPYCPDRFHNGIGLANHVRGHLNRVGVSYNVRHFISPEEVNAIEKKFSYQKKKKKGQQLVAFISLGCAESVNTAWLFCCLFLIYV